MSGVYQRLINQIPPHRVYIESHLGGGAIMRYKKLAEINIGIDLDQCALDTWIGAKHINLVHADAADFLSSYSFMGDEFVYADPPYLPSTRRSDRALYRFDYTCRQHSVLLEVLTHLPCNVMISGYWSALYGQYLGDWRTIQFTIRTRSGDTAEEWVWMNYPQPKELHDYRYLGETFREREKIRRRIQRYKARLEQLSPLERRAILAEVL